MVIDASREKEIYMVRFSGHMSYKRYCDYLNTAGVDLKLSCDGNDRKFGPNKPSKKTVT